MEKGARWLLDVVVSENRADELTEGISGCEYFLEEDLTLLCEGREGLATSSSTSSIEDGAKIT